MKPDPENKAQEEMEELAAKAIRPSRMLSIGDLLASELATSVLSEPLGKIRHIVEALMLLTEEEWRSVGITEEEHKEAEKLYALALALQNTYVHQVQDEYGHIIDLYAAIAWPFPQKEAREWLGWADKVSVMYWSQGARADEKFEEELRAIEDNFEKDYHIATYKTTVHTYRTYVTRFAQYAMPKATALMRRIVGLVSAESYLQALKIMRGKRGKQRANP